MRKWYPALLVVAAIVVAIAAYPHLPDRVPTHWNRHLEPNRYTSRWVATVRFPLVLLGAWGLLRLLRTIDPWRANYLKFQRTYELMVNAALTVALLLHTAMIAAATGLPIALGRVIPVLVGALLVVMGNVLPRVRPNFWFGVRTPWTLTNERVWIRTHRLAGYVFVVAGVCAIAAAMLPTNAAVPVLLALGGAAALVTVLYSYVAWRQETS